MDWQGEARVYRLSDENNDGDATDEGERTVFASGFTTMTVANGGIFSPTGLETGSGGSRRESNPPSLTRVREQRI